MPTIESTSIPYWMSSLLWLASSLLKGMGYEIEFKYFDKNG